MKLAFLEDRPWIVWEMVMHIKTKYKLPEIMVIYYKNSENTENTENIENTENTGNGKLDELIKKCVDEKIKFKEINRWNFEEQMNQLYDDSEIKFFFDLVLDDNVDYFEDRINVRYARDKKVKEAKEGKEERIWFYTTSGAYNVTNIMNVFGENQIVDVINYNPETNQIEFAENALNRILNNDAINKK